MAREKIYHFVYETTNNINGKKYIGKHSTNNINDGYLGSGKLLKLAVSKYGEEHFSRKIISIFDSSDAAFEFESLVVDEDLIKNKNYYNCKPGGCGGIYMTEEIKERMKASSKLRFERLEGTTLGTTCYTNGKRNKFLKPGQLPPTGYQIGISTPNRKSRKGCEVKPTTTGTFWVNNGTINKLIHPGNDIPEGFVKGRLMKTDKSGRFSKA